MCVCCVWKTQTVVGEPSRGREITGWYPAGFLNKAPPTARRKEVPEGVIAALGCLEDEPWTKAVVAFRDESKSILPGSPLKLPVNSSPRFPENITQILYANSPLRFCVHSTPRFCVDHSPLFSVYCAKD
ncbi:unnamed protein product [Arctogadus glacialis]